MQIIRSPSFPGNCKDIDLIISLNGWVQTDANWHQNPLPAPFSRLYLIAEGSGVLFTDQEQLKLEPGYAYLAPCGCPCGFYGTDSVTKLFFHINITMHNGYDLFSSCKSLAQLPFPVSRTEQLRDWFLSEDPTGHILIKGVLWELASAFGSQLCISSGGSYSEVVSSAMGFIRKNLSAQLTVKSVCEAVFCAPAKLTALFRKEIGVTVGRYIEDLVMQEARELLLSSDKTVGSISQELGFCDQFYFTRRFSARYGLTPKDYRNRTHRYSTLI